MWTALVWLYFGIAAIALAFTWKEQRGQKDMRLGWKLMGFCLCLFWPLILLGALILRLRR